MLYLARYEENQQIRELYKKAQELKLEATILELKDAKLSISGDRVSYGNLNFTQEDIFYFHGFKNEFPFIPRVNYQSDGFSFAFDYIVAQQQKSHLYSFLVALSRSYQTVNSFWDKLEYETKPDFYDKLQNSFLKIPDYCQTNSFELFKKSSLAEKDTLLWSQVAIGSPFSKISSKNYQELFTNKQAIPLLIMESLKGTKVRVWFYKETPLLAALVTPPSMKAGQINLEKYKYITQLDFLNPLAKELEQKLELDFYAVTGIVDGKEEFWLEDLEIDPVLNYLPENARIYLYSLLLEKMTGKDLGREPFAVAEEERQTVFIERMLQPLFEIKESF